MVLTFPPDVATMMTAAAVVAFIALVAVWMSR